MFDGLIDGYTQSILIFTGISVIAAYSFFAPFKTGQVSLGQAGFMAVGGYASAVLTQKFGLPFAAALPVAGLIAGVVGVVVGFPALRIKGIYLLLLTLGFGEIISVIALSWDYVGGAQGYRNIPFNPRTLDYVIGIVIVLVDLLRPARALEPRPRDGLDPSGRDRGGGDGHRRGAHQAVGLRARRDDRRHRRRALCASGDVRGLDHVQHHAGGGDPDVRGGRRRQHVSGGRWSAPSVLSYCPNSCARLREWLELLPVAMTNFFPANRVYDFLHGFLDFENAKRLIVYGLILILMMIVRPDGLLTRDTLPRLPSLAEGAPCLSPAWRSKA